MSISPVSTTTPKKSSKTYTTTPQNKIEKPKDEPKYTKKQVSGMVLATALSAAVLAGGAVKGRRSWELRRLRGEVTDLRGVRDTLETTQQKVKSLTNDNQRLQDEVNAARNKLKDLFEGVSTPSDARNKIRQRLEAKINGELNYDVSTPPVTGKADPVKKVNKDALDLPERVGTTNRAGSIDLHIPEIATDGRFNF